MGLQGGVRVHDVGFGVRPCAEDVGFDPGVRVVEVDGTFVCVKVDALEDGMHSGCVAHVDVVHIWLDFKLEDEDVRPEVRVVAWDDVMAVERMQNGFPEVTGGLGDGADGIRADKAVNLNCSVNKGCGSTLDIGYVGRNSIVCECCADRREDVGLEDVGVVKGEGVADGGGEGVVCRTFVECVDCKCDEKDGKDA